MKLYQSPKAPNPDRVVFFLRAKGRLDDVEMEEISIMELEHRTPEYRAISPMSQVPALVLDDGRTLTESRAICTYFEALWPEPNLFGSDPYEKGEIEMWERRIELMWMLQFAFWFRNAHPMMAPLENPQVPEMAEKCERNCRTFVKRLDKHLATNDFIAAGRFTNADISAFVCCGFSRVMKWNPAKENENISGWFGRMKEIGFAG